MFSDLFEDKPREVRPKRRIEDPREFLLAVMNEDPEVMNSDYLSVRMRAAVELLPYSNPKLMATAIINEGSFAELLERRLARMAETKLIEQQPAPTVEVKPPLPRVPDRRFRRI